MLVLVTYDVETKTPEGRRRLRRIAKHCEDWGQRAQNSVFECVVEPAQWTELKKRLLDEIDPGRDSLRFYNLGKNWQNRIEHFGSKPTYDPEEDVLLV